MTLSSVGASTVQPSRSTDSLGGLPKTIPHGLHHLVISAGHHIISKQKTQLSSFVCRKQGMQYYPPPLLSAVLRLAVILLVALITPDSAAAASRTKKPLTTQPQPEERTHIRPGTPVFLVTQGSKGSELKHLNVTVKNVGRNTAKGVLVFVELSGGLMNQLRGASTLAPGQSGIYLLRSRTPLIHSGPVRILTSCTNCRR